MVPEVGYMSRRPCRVSIRRVTIPDGAGRCSHIWKDLACIGFKLQLAVDITSRDVSSKLHKVQPCWHANMHNGLTLLLSESSAS